MKEQYKYSLWSRIEKLGWVVVPLPASGGGRKGHHRPDIILGNKKRVYVAEVKNSKLPLYLNIEKDVNPVLELSEALKAEPIIIVKRKFSRDWVVFQVDELTKCSSQSYVIREDDVKNAKLLEDFLCEC